MPRFRYTAYSADGVREDGVLDAVSEGQAWDKLTSLNLTVVELLQDAGGNVAVKARWFAGHTIPLAAQADLAEQLAVLFRARLSAMQIVDVLAKGSSLPVIRRKFQRIGHLMADGKAFPDALSDTDQGLSPLFVSLTRIGHKTGDPSALMKSLATTLRRQQKISAQIGSALVYPIILVIGGLGILALMSLYLAPRLATIFSSVGKDSPAAISIFVGFGDLLSDWWIGLASLGTLLLATIPALLRRNRYQLNALIQKLPIVGAVARDASLARLSRSVHIMLAAAMPLAPTLRATASALPLEPLARHFDAAATSIEAGGSGRDSFANASDLSPIFRELFAIGESTNTLGAVMDSVATALEDQVERSVQRAMVLLTPILTLLVGGGIAVLVYAVMSALLSVNDMAF